MKTHGLDVYSFDNPDFNIGNKETDPAPSIERCAGLIRQTLDRKGLQKVSIAGLSMGGMIAAQLATQIPERVQHLFICASSANLPRHPALPPELISSWKSVETPAQLKDSVAIAFGKTCIDSSPSVKEDYFQYRLANKNKQGRLGFYGQLDAISNFNGESVYSNLRATDFEKTFVFGEEDRLFGKNHQSDAIGLLPTAKVITLARTGHMLHLERPEEFARVIAEQ